MHEDLPLVLRVLRDISDAEVEKLRIDSRETFQRVESFVRQFTPELADKLEYYPGERPIFDLYSIDDEIQKALERKVQLKSGGHLVFDQTEAMTTIDVNTGAYVGHRNLEETIFKTNLEAAQAIVRHLRLRNLGGIIIVDFIDMQTEEHKRQVLRALEKHIERDNANCHISEISSLGLVQMTRKRTRESLEHILCEALPNLWWTGLGENGGNRLLRNIPGNSARGHASLMPSSCWCLRLRKLWICCLTKSRPASPNSRLLLTSRSSSRLKRCTPRNSSM